jgi:hypothetical protein
MTLRELVGQKPVMLVPMLRDLDNFQKVDQVRQQCRRCAIQLSAHLFIWRKAAPSKSTIKSWCPTERKFLGMDIALFQEFIQDHFIIKTKDGNQWLCDPKIAALIWEACVSSESPLPEASWEIEREKQRRAA